MTIQTNKGTIFSNSMRLLFLLLLVYAVGYIGSTFTTPKALSWYDTLNLSPLNPPAQYFGLVWSILYFLMACSAWLVWGKTTPRPFVMQLAFNLVWTFLFFYLKSPLWALIDTIAIIFFVGCTIYKFGKVSRLAGWLMIPTLLWCLFAFYLNLYVVLYN